MCKDAENARPQKDRILLGPGEYTNKKNCNLILTEEIINFVLYVEKIIQHRDI